LLDQGTQKTVPKPLAVQEEMLTGDMDRKFRRYELAARNAAM
jgi:hypothetical protein